MGVHAEFSIGSEVDCGDEACGKLQRVVVNPVARKLTHLVVEATQGSGAGRLVPIVLASSADGRIRLACTLAEFDKLEPAEETDFIAGPTGEWGYDQQHLLAWPFYGLGLAGAGGPGGETASGQPTALQSVTHERVPAGEVQVRRGERVHAADGDIGRVQGLVVDPADHGVTHILLTEGHLWGKKRVAIPIGAVATVDGTGVRLRFKKDEVRDLPEVELAEQG